MFGHRQTRQTLTTLDVAWIHKMVETHGVREATIRINRRMDAMNTPKPERAEALHIIVTI